MGVIYTITFRGMKLNKKRTLLTILTIILSVGMMTAVLCGLWSMLGFLQTKEKAYGGDYEYSIENLSLQQAEVLKNKNNVDDVSLFLLWEIVFMEKNQIKVSLRSQELTSHL